MLLQVLCIVHVIRNGRNQLWIPERDMRAARDALERHREALPLYREAPTGARTGFKLAAAELKPLDRHQRAGDAEMYRWAGERLRELRG